MISCDYKRNLLKAIYENIINKKLKESRDRAEIWAKGPDSTPEKFWMDGWDRMAVGAPS